MTSPQAVQANGCQNGVAVRRDLPEDLRFIAEWPLMSAMARSEKATFTRRHLEQLKHHREPLIACGYDVDRMIANLEPALATLENSMQAAGAAEEALMTAFANVATIEDKFFETCTAALEQAGKDKPFDPHLEEWKEIMDGWRQRTPHA